MRSESCREALSRELWEPFEAGFRPIPGKAPPPGVPGLPERDVPVQRASEGGVPRAAERRPGAC